MTNVIPMNFRDNLVRVVHRDDDADEPWFVGKDVCAVLEISKHHQALDRLDDDERGTCTVGTPSGSQEMIVVSEPGVFRLIFTSRKPQAEEFKRWLAHEVLPALRRDGFYALGQRPEPSPVQVAAEIVEGTPLGDRVAAVRLGMRLFGHERARLMWAQFGLPTPPVATHGGGDEARRILATVLMAPVAATGNLLTASVWHHLHRAIFDDDEAAASVLRDAGILAVEDDQAPGFILSNRSMFVREALDGTGHAGTYPLLFRRLEGTSPSGRHRFAGHQARGTFIPVRYLDVVDDADDPRWSTLPMP